MPKKTEHYQLNQYEPQDSFLRTDFNEDNAKIDAALAGKTEVFAGSYTGNGAASRFIDLGFTPRAVLLDRNDGHRGSGIGGIIVPGSGLKGTGPTVEIVEGGFQITASICNYANNIYHYVAFR